MKKYGQVDGFRLLNIRVIYDDSQILYDGPAEEVPSDIGQLYYSKTKQITENSKNIWQVFVYSDEYIESKELEQN